MFLFVSNAIYKFILFVLYTNNVPLEGIKMLGFSFLCLLIFTKYALNLICIPNKN